MPDLSDVPLEALVIDPKPRPKMVPIPGATDAHRRKGRQLAMIHAHYLQEVARADAVLRRIRAGDAPPEELQGIILHSDMRRNFAAAGTVCGHQCAMLKMHHDIEEAHMFPGLEAPAHAVLNTVVARLKDEHKIIHELLNRLSDAAEALAQDPSPAHFDTAERTFQTLRTAISSHFGYEEEELAEAIGLYLDGI